MKTSLAVTKRFGHASWLNFSPIRTKTIRFFLALVLFSAFGLIQSCHFYKVTPVTQPQAASFPVTSGPSAAARIFFLHDSTQTWYLKNPEVKNDTLFAEFIQIYNYRQHPMKRQGNYPYNPKHTSAIKEVHLYTQESALSIAGPGSLKLGEIRLADFYDDNSLLSSIATVGLILFVIPPLVITAGYYAVLAVSLITGSCPFIYSYDGKEYQLSGEIYAGAMHQPLERHDYLVLDNLKPAEDQYRIQIRNELHEIENTNLAELLIYDHPENVRVLTDKYGNYQSVSCPAKPLSAESRSGDNLLPLVSESDYQTYHGEMDPDKISLHQEVILSFPRKDGSQTARLIIRAKNSNWLEYTFSELQKKTGFLYESWSGNYRKADPASMQKWSLDQNIPLSVYVERNNTWEFADYFNVAGPVAMKEDILSINLDPESNGPIRIKLVTGNQFWEVDCVSLDQSDPAAVTVHRVSASSAVNQGNENVLPGLLSDDERYYSQPNIGDQAELIFNVPENRSQARTIVLHSKGWYHKLLNSKGLPDFARGKTYKNPDELSRFSNELLIKALSAKAL